MSELLLACPIRQVLEERANKDSVQLRGVQQFNNRLAWDMLTLRRHRISCVLCVAMLDGGGDKRSLT